MPKFPPTPEQQAIIDFATSSRQNLMVNALAGAAKTSTLVLISEALPNEEFLTLAFNKRIQVEMAERLPPNCTALTLNSAGHRAWGAFLHRRLRLDARKMYRLLDAWLEEHRPDLDDDFFEDEYDDVLQTVKKMKGSGWIPDRYKHPAFKPKRLLSDEEFRAELDFDPSPLQWSAIEHTMLESISQSFDGYIDFDDQIMMSALFPATFKNYPNTMVDEAQDLSALNHLMLRKMVGASGRLFAVGDPYQAIYGFRGAHDKSMSLMQQDFNMHELGLSVSFRCPIAVVKAAQWRAPHMKFPEWAAQGSVKSLDLWHSKDVPEDAVIICRNNAPLFNLGVKLLNAGRHVEIVGIDMSKRLIKIFESFGANEMPQEEVLRAIEIWSAKEIAKGRKEERVADLSECLTSFATNAENLAGAIKAVETIFSSQGPLKLMTGHKSKGLEWHSVFILDRHLLRLKDEPGKPAGQDKNLLYVMQTRAMSELTYITTEGFQG